jgi:hypothetical protein
MATTGSARPVTVYVNIIDAAKKDVKLQSTDVPVIQDFIVQFNNNQTGIYSPGFLVDFSLPATLGQNASWTFDAADPIWVKLVDKHGACPRNKNDDQPGILTNPTLSAGNRILTVGNANSIEQYFGFALRFENTTTGKGLTYDPIGNNQNGPS